MTPRTESPSIPQRHHRAALVALLDGQQVGSVYQRTNGQLRFLYDDQWRENPDAYPLSLSMPLAAVEHRHEAVSAFLWGLLPDNSRTLDQYGRIFGVSSGNPVALLAHMGADCAGAVQFAPPSRIDAILGAASAPPTVDWISEAEIAGELRTVRERGVPGTSLRTAGQFSLAGAQPKIALLEQGRRWGRPGGRTPTNRILKPPSKEFPGFAENEHFCLDLALELELGAVRSRVLMFEDEVAIVVDRFDRAFSNGVYRRVHQEDVCQALGIVPTRKYENEGGPGIAAIISLLRDTSGNSAEDVDRFIGVTVLNWILAATDAHAKNYALLHGHRGTVRLAPFFDIASYLPYADRELHRVKLAMKIGSTYLVRRITRASWEALARTNGMPVGQVLARAEDVLTRLPGAIETVRARAIREGLDLSLIDRLAARVRERVLDCAASLA